MMWLLVRAKDNSDVDVYTVHEPPAPPLDRIDHAASMVFVRDGFSWGAALFSPVYLAVKGQWFAFVAYLVLGFLAAAVLWSVGLIQNWFTFMVIGLNIYLGFEASTLERMWLNYRGWREVGTVAGRNLPECERRFFENWLGALPADTRSTTLSAEPGFFGASWHRMLFGRA
jgi:Protein of unknown function (DUF2628)